MLPVPRATHPGPVVAIAVLIAAAQPARAGDDAIERPAKVPTAVELSVQPPTLLEMIGKRSIASNPALAFAAYRALLLKSVKDPALAPKAKLGLANCWLTLGNAAIASRYADDLLAARPRSPEVWALRLRATLRAGDFETALRQARIAAETIGLDDPELRAAHASALFRNREIEDAQRGYRKVLAAEPTNVEALIRLGTGLLPPKPARITPELRRAVDYQRRGLFDRARTSLVAVLGSKPEHPIALRMLGELLIAEDRARGALVRDGFFDSMWRRLAPRSVVPIALRGFFPNFDRLSPDRRRVIAWSCRPFISHLKRCAAAGGHHDILLECERTTDAEPRAWLRGRRTFDGRVWDDVRGIGGLCAATGVEALDDTRSGGFQTLIHELAHQVHHYSLSLDKRRRITELYRDARRDDHTLDYYAASNEAEYFAQGVEAYFSYAKAPGQPVTHGHTHFELKRRDPALYAFIVEIVENDPLRQGDAQALLRHCLDAAIEVGRARDARTILEMLPVSRRRRELGRRVARAENRFLTI